MASKEASGRRHHSRHEGVRQLPRHRREGERNFPRFRAALVGTYHKGIQVGLRWDTLTKHDKDDRWRRTNYKAGETGDIKVVLIGLIPFENIENVDWDGDNFYNYPHIYCFFSFRKEPYEHVGYYTQTTPLHGLPFYTEVASYDSVRRLSKKLGIVT